jgi:sugar/nucleoside kinase (ribokinase family)
MKIGIIGQACIDEIIAPSGETRSQALGGIAYSYAALERLARMSGADVTVVPFGFVSLPDKTLLEGFSNQLTRFDLSKMIPTQDRTNRVQLVYHDDSSRTEHCPSILPKLTLADLRREGFADLDALFVNMISGFDVTLEALEQIAVWSDEFGFHTHLDIHALSLGPLSQGDSEFGGGRKAQGLKDWERWIGCAHTIQLNELEADHIGEPEFSGQVALLNEIGRFVTQSQLSRLNATILTRAAKGATIYDHRTDSTMNVSAPPVRVIDTTGSGDVFGAAFTFGMAEGRSIRSSVQRAIELATFNTQLSGVEALII